MISGGRGEDHHFLLLTIKIRLASTVSTLASVKAWQGREGGQTPPPRLRVCHVNYGDPTVPFTDCSGLKEIHNPFLLANTVTDGISAPSFLYFGNSLLLVSLPCFIKTQICNSGITIWKNKTFICEQYSPIFHFFVFILAFRSSSLYPHYVYELLRSAGGWHSSI